MDKIKTTWFVRSCDAGRVIGFKFKTVSQIMVATGTQILIAAHKDLEFSFPNTRPDISYVPCQAYYRKIQILASTNDDIKAAVDLLNEKRPVSLAAYCLKFYFHTFSAI